MPMVQAELAAVILWPSFLACLMVLVLAHGTDRLMGKAAAVGALAVFLTWGKLGGEFVPPRIDHHNVQILCGTALFYLSLIPGRARILGALAGVVTAVSLAVGLEMLPFLATIWGLMALRHAFAQPNAGDWLLGFAAAITLAAPMLLAGQTPASDWWINHCDVLAPPVMALGAVGVVATLVPVLAERVLTGPFARILALGVTAALGLWLAYPLLGDCLAGPYSNVPPEVRLIIESNVNEARSASILLSLDPDLLARVLAPPLIIAVFALVTAWHLRGRLGQAQSMALLQAFVVLGVGFGFALVQIRAANLMAPALPLLGGFLLHAFTLISRTSTMRLPAAILLVVALPATVERGASILLLPSAPLSSSAGPQAMAKPALDCRSAAAMAEIASLPGEVIFSTLNVGPAIVAYTSHSATSASYHRSPAAFWNGVGAFETVETLRAALANSGADYLVLCVGTVVGPANPELQSMLAGELPDWLTDATSDRVLVRALMVNKAALADAGSAP